MHKTRPWLWILLAITVAGAGASRAYRPTAALVPDEVLGVWITDAPQYEGRRFEITPSTLVFTSNLINSSKYEVARSVVRLQASRMTPTDSNPQMTLYTFKYGRGENSSTFSFYLIASPEPTIRFKNQPNMQWTKAGPD